MNCEKRIKKICQTDAMCLRNKPEPCSVSIEAPWTTDRSNFEGWLPVTIQELATETTSRVFIGEFNDRRAVPTYINDSDKVVWKYALY
jgi:hypothetical protein